MNEQQRTVVVQMHEKPGRWSTWRDIVIFLQTIGLAALLLLYLQGRDAAAADRSEASKERKTLITQVAGLNEQIARLTAENRRLVNLLLQAGVDPKKVQAAAPSSTGTGSTSRSSTTSTTTTTTTPTGVVAPQPSPSPSPSPSAAPKPKPSPTPTCTVKNTLPVGPACLVR